MDTHGSAVIQAIARSQGSGHHWEGPYIMILTTPMAVDICIAHTILVGCEHCLVWEGGSDMACPQEGTEMLSDIV